MRIEVRKNRKHKPNFDVAFAVVVMIRSTYQKNIIYNLDDTKIEQIAISYKMSVKKLQESIKLAFRYKLLARPDGKRYRKGCIVKVGLFDNKKKSNYILINQAKLKTLDFNGILALCRMSPAILKLQQCVYMHDKAINIKNSLTEPKNLLELKKAKRQQKKFSTKSSEIGILTPSVQSLSNKCGISISTFYKEFYILQSLGLMDKQRRWTTTKKERNFMQKKCTPYPLVKGGFMNQHGMIIKMETNTYSFNHFPAMYSNIDSISF